MAESFILNKVNSRTSLFAQKAIVVAFYTREASPIVSIVADWEHVTQCSKLPLS